MRRRTPRIAALAQQQLFADEDVDSGQENHQNSSGSNTSAHSRPRSLVQIQAGLAADELTIRDTKGRAVRVARELGRETLWTFTGMEGHAWRATLDPRYFGRYCFVDADGETYVVEDWDTHCGAVIGKDELARVAQHYDVDCRVGTDEQRRLQRLAPMLYAYNEEVKQQERLAATLKNPERSARYAQTTKLAALLRSTISDMFGYELKSVDFALKLYRNQLHPRRIDNLVRTVEEDD